MMDQPVITYSQVVAFDMGILLRIARRDKILNLYLRKFYF
ncbi:MAG: hypothetical protein ACI83P_001104 [Janthinobacterium sp.]|jgi:hypothetical protein